MIVLILALMLSQNFKTTPTEELRFVFLGEFSGSCSDPGMIELTRDEQVNLLVLQRDSYEAQAGYYVLYGHLVKELIAEKDDQSMWIILQKYAPRSLTLGRDVVESELAEADSKIRSTLDSLDNTWHKVFFAHGVKWGDTVSVSKDYRCFFKVKTKK